MDTIVVIPCFNEASRLDVAAFERFAATDSGVRLLFVDDGSTDGTADILAGLHARMPASFEVLELPRNRGKGEAVRQGVLQALEARPRFVGYWDADLSTPLDQIVVFQRLLEDDDRLVAVVGSRVKRLGATIRRRAVRHYLGRVFATLASLILGLDVYDTQCGAKLFRNGAALRELFETPFLSRWIFDVEIFARLAAAFRESEVPAGRRLLEHPLPSWYDVPGSKLAPSHMLGAIVDLLRIRRAYR